MALDLLTNKFQPTTNVSNFLPTLSTTFPKTTTVGTKVTPVVTSNTADDHINKMGDAIASSTNDIAKASIANANVTAQKTAQEQAQKQQDIENKQNQPEADPTTAILNALTGVENTQVKPDSTQQNVLDTDTSQNQIDEGYLSQVSDAIDQMNAGTYPLSTSEKASVDNVASSFTSAFQAAKDLTQNQTEGQKILNAKSGIAMYSPTEAISNIAKIVKTGNQKVADINTKLIDAQNKLTQAFHDQDFKTATSLYTKISDTIKQRTDEINNINKSVSDATKQMHDDAQANAKMQMDAIMNDHTISYQDKQQAIAQANLDEKVRHDKQTELAQNTVTNPVQNLPSVSMTPDNTVNPVDQQTFLGNLPGGATGELATLVKGISNYTINPSSIPTRQYKGVGGLTQAQVLALASQYDPTFNQAQYATRQAYLKNVQSGNIYNGIVAANKAINHLINFNTSVGSIGNGGVSSGLNKLGTEIEKPFSSNLQQNVKQAQTEANGVKDELAKFFKGTGTSDVNSIADWGNSLNVNATPAEQRGTMQGALTLLAGQLDVLNQQYTNTMGKAPNQTFLQPQTIQKLSTLKNQGFQVDIPGVNYTDKLAWAKYGGGTQDAWNDAVDRLTKLNIPLTDENILQAAQNL